MGRRAPVWGLDVSATTSPPSTNGLPAGRSEAAPLSSLPPPRTKPAGPWATGPTGATSFPGLSTGKGDHRDIREVGLQVQAPGKARTEASQHVHSKAPSNILR